MDVTALGTVIFRHPVLGPRDVTHARGQRLEQWVQTFHFVGVTADHHAITTLQAPHAAGGADVDVFQAFLRQGLGTTDVVLIEGIAAVDDHVTGFQQLAQGFDGVFGRCASGQHDPDRARLGQASHQCGQVGNAGCAFLGQGINERGVAVVDHSAMPVEHQAPCNVAAHAAQSNDP